MRRDELKSLDMVHTTETLQSNIAMQFIQNVKYANKKPMNLGNLYRLCICLHRVYTNKEVDCSFSWMKSRNKYEIILCDLNRLGLI